MCEHPNCNQRPIFNILGETTPRFCNQHKTPEMVNLLKKNKCEHGDCTMIPTCMFKGDLLPIYCFQHKFADMIEPRQIVV